MAAPGLPIFVALTSYKKFEKKFTKNFNLLIYLLNFLYQLSTVGTGTVKMQQFLVIKTGSTTKFEAKNQFLINFVTGCLSTAGAVAAPLAPAPQHNCVAVPN